MKYGIKLLNNGKKEWVLNITEKREYSNPTPILFVDYEEAINYANRMNWNVFSIEPYPYIE